MRNATSLAIIFILTGCNDLGPWEGPFGTQRGITIEQLSRFAKLREGETGAGYRVFTSKQAPDQSASFQEYTYKFGETGGLCSAAGLIAAGEASNVYRRVADQFGAPNDSGDAVEWNQMTHHLGDGVRSIQLLKAGGEPRVILYELIASDECQ